MNTTGPKRSPYLDQEYFDEAVAKDQSDITDFRQIVANPDTPETHRRRLLYTIFRQSLQLLITRYSRGEAISDLKRSFPSLVDDLVAYQEVGDPTDFRDFDEYVHALWLVSLALLFEVDDPLLGRLLKALDNEGRDALFENLVRSRVPDRDNPQGLMFPNPYKPLLEALNATGGSQAKLISDFLKNYYRGMQKAYWYDTHRDRDSGFFGYWCLELAALVKVYGLDDSSFADNPYYPRDLARA